MRKKKVRFWGGNTFDSGKSVGGKRGKNWDGGGAHGDFFRRGKKNNRTPKGGKKGGKFPGKKQNTFFGGGRGHASKGGGFS